MKAMPLFAMMQRRYSARYRFRPLAASAAFMNDEPTYRNTRIQLIHDEEII